MPDILNITEFGGEDHSVSQADRKPSQADIAKDVELPTQTSLAKRKGYANYYPTRPNWFDFTTPNNSTQRMVDADFADHDGGEYAYNTQGRKCVVYLKDPVTLTKYAFLLWFYVKGALVTFWIYRGTIGADGEIVWDDTVRNNASAAYNLTATAGFVYLGNDAVASAQEWMDGSLCASYSDYLYLALVTRDDEAAAPGGWNWSNVSVFKITNIFGAAASFGTDPVWTRILNTTVDNADSDCITHDVDLAYHTTDSGGFLHLIYGFYETGKNPPFYLIHGRYNETTSAWTSTDFGKADFYCEAARLLRDPSSANIYMIYTREDATAVAHTLRCIRWAYSATIPAESTSLMISSPGAVIETAGAKAFCGACVSIDSDGIMYVAFRSNTQVLLLEKCVFNAGFTVVTTTVYTVTTTLANGAVLHATHLPQRFTCWDIVAREGVPFVYYVVAANADTILWQCVDPMLSTPALTTAAILHKGIDQIHFLCTDRIHSTYAARRMSFIDYNSTTHLEQIKYIRHEKDDLVDNIAIDSMHHYKMPRVDTDAISTHIVQCNDNRFYKRNLTEYWHWELLENTMDVNNDYDAWWMRLSDTVANGGLALAAAPAPTDVARYDDLKGVVRAGLGCGDTKVGIWYGLINRYFGTNDTANKYNDHLLDVSPLTPPGTDNILPWNGATLPAYDQQFGVRTQLMPEGPPTYPNYRMCCYRNQMQGQGDLIIAPEFVPNEELARFAPDRELFKGRAYFVALSFLYDGYEESQLYVLPPAYMNLYYWPTARILPQFVLPNLTWGAGERMLSDAIWIGGIREDANHPWRAVPFVDIYLRIRHWNAVYATGAIPPSRTNPRITAIRVWFADCLTKTQRSDESLYYPVKTCLIAKDTQFKAEAWKGDQVWTYAAPYFSASYRIDIDDILTGIKSGTYAEINGHSYTPFKYEAEKGLELSPFPESYKHSQVFGNTRVIGNVRINAVNRPNRLMWNAIGSEMGFAAEQHDVFPNFKDFPFNMESIIKIDDNTPGVIGDNGNIVKMSLPDFGTVETFPDKLGSLAVNGVTRFDLQIPHTMFLCGNKLYVFNGSDTPEYISDPIGRDTDTGSYKGLESSTLTTSTAWAFHIPKEKKTLVFLPTNSFAFCYDWVRKAWYRYHFNASFACGCVGTDGQLFFSDGDYVYEFPSGTTDNATAISPLWKSGGKITSRKTHTDLERMQTEYKLVPGGAAPATTLKVSIIRDNGDLAALVKALAASSTRKRLNVNFGEGNKVKREVAVQFELNNASDAGVMEIEAFNLEGVELEEIT